MEKTNESSRMTSIARRISMDFWLKQFSDFLLIDLLIAGLVVMTFFFWREGLVPEGQIAADRYFQGEDLAGLQYVIETDSGGVYSCYIRDTLEMLRVPAIILLVCEGLILTGRLFGTGRVRRRMKPLYDIAVRTEQLSSQPFDSGKFESMEKAISSLDPDLPGARITTGDKDLLSLEIAINNMLERMRESHRQQERFVSDASHELRTPVSVIQGYVNMLDRWGKEDEKILEEGIEAIKNESEHMKNLIEQLLFLARGDGGRNTLHMTEFDLTEMVRDVWE
ncbi:MAG: histidine kinase dimerization/phospho-acceptor domain-containing protein, partial [Emergencia sp.]